MSIGVAAPVFEAGTMAAMSPACRRKKPALAARAPLGATNAMIGTRERSSACVIFRIESRRPPGVSIWSTSAES